LFAPVALRKHGARTPWLVQQLFAVALKVFALVALRWLLSSLVK
jgi:hypothetical protein